MSDLDSAFAAALACHEGGRLAEAERLYRHVLALRPRHADSLHLLGLIAHQTGRDDVAATLIGEAIGIDPARALFHGNLGLVLQALGRPGDAIAAFETALRLRPDFVEARSNLGGALQAAGRGEEAESAYRSAIAADPEFAQARYNLGNLLQERNDFIAAVRLYRGAIALIPAYPEAWANLANGCLRLGQSEESLAAARAALRMNPVLPEGWLALGGALRALGRPSEAVSSFQRAAELAPDLAEARCNLGTMFKETGRFGDAAAEFAAALRIRPDFSEALAQGFHVAQHLCDWRDYDARATELLDRISVAEPPLPPYIVLTLDATPAQQRLAAERWLESRCGAIAPLPPPERQRPSGRIRLGYLSAEFRAHAVPFLIAELIERHDRDRFEVFGYSIGPDDGSAMRRRLERAFDHFIDLRPLPHRAAAERIRDDRIDLLVDLSGCTRDARPEILAYRPAPVAVNFLGYPGAMSRRVVDFIIGDAVCTPEEQDRAYGETVIRLPHCYQPNDTARAIAAATPSRAECGLPDPGFVFCCFNNAHKITPRLFDVWMRLLSRLPGSVLWLLEANGEVKDNLRREARIRGLDEGRLVFAPRRPPAEHLARHRLADLFLDTLPYNAHTTASDALWAGLPVLTCAGRTFAGRVAASLLRAIGLPDLVTGSLEEYEAAALRLAADPAALAEVRARLAANRSSWPLFDIDAYRRDIEAAYLALPPLTSRRDEKEKARPSAARWHPAAGASD